LKYENLLLKYYDSRIEGVIKGYGKKSTGGADYFLGEENKSDTLYNHQYDESRNEVAKVKVKLIFIIVMCSFLISCDLPGIPHRSGQKYISFNQVLRDKLNKPIGTITKADYESVKRLFYSTSGGALLKSIDGIQKCTNLEGLSIPRNHVKNLAPLVHLKKLRRLNLDSQRLDGGHNRNNQLIESLDPLSDLTNLEYLNLGSCAISDIQALSSLTNLRELNLSGNLITDLSPLNNLQKLRKLNILFNDELRDFSPIGNLINLQELDISMSHEPGNLSGFENLKLIRELDLNLYYFGWPRDGNREDSRLYYEDREAFQKKYPIKELNIESVTRMPNLEDFTISSYNAIVDLSPLHQFEKLQNLRLNINKAEDIEYISQIPSFLKSLRINIKVDSADLSAFSKLKYLSSLSISVGANVDPPYIPALTKLQHLRGLSLSYEGNTDVCYDSIGQIETLKTLYLGAQSLTSLEFLGGNTRIWKLRIGQNKIADLAPLLDMQKLAHLYIYPVCLSLETKDVILPALEKKGVQIHIIDSR